MITSCFSCCQGRTVDRVQHNLPPVSKHVAKAVWLLKLRSRHVQPLHRFKVPCNYMLRDQLVDQFFSPTYKASIIVNVAGTLSDQRVGQLQIVRCRGALPTSRTALRRSLNILETWNRPGRVYQRRFKVRRKRQSLFNVGFAFRQTVSTSMVKL